MIKDLIALEDSSKVWIYKSNRTITYDELDEMRPEIFHFLDQWTSHDKALITYGNIFHQRFLGLFVDETFTGASGCSIDKSVNFITALGNKYDIDFFDRTTFSYLKDDEVHDISSKDVKKAYQQNEIGDDVLFFDHLVKTKGDFLKSWLVPLNKSWHNRFI